MTTPRAAARRLLVALALLAAPATALGAQDAPTVVFLARHAEKAAAPAEDPPLTAAGQERARQLSGLLGDVGLDRVLSTDLARTRDTATPAAARSGVEVEPYDARRLAAVAAELRAGVARRILVVGHSNTTPELVRLLGGEPGPPIDEPAEYDRLYVLTIPARGPVTTLVLRYGRRFRP